MDDIDSGVRNICDLLNRRGVKTLFSCSALVQDHPKLTVKGKIGQDRLYKWFTPDVLVTITPYVCFEAPPGSLAHRMAVSLQRSLPQGSRVDFRDRPDQGPQASVHSRIYAKRFPGEDDERVLDRLNTLVQVRWAVLEQLMGIATLEVNP